jgi:hypothetical protein
MICFNSAPSMIEMSAFEALGLKLSLPSFQKGMKRVVFMLPAIRSGRSVKKIVTGLTPVNVNALLVLSKVVPFRALHEQIVGLLRSGRRRRRLSRRNGGQRCGRHPRDGHKTTAGYPGKLLVHGAPPCRLKLRVGRNPFLPNA